MVPMRLNLVLLGLSAIFLFLSLRLQEESIVDATDSSATLRKIHSLKRAFIKNHQPILRFSIEKLPQFQEDLSLLDPKMGFPRTHHYPYGQMQKLFESMKTCRWEDGFSSWHPNLLKAVIWHQYMCDPGSRLPQKFFQVQPLMHPFGSSYAYLAYRSGRVPYSKKEWLLENRGRLHVSELKTLEMLTALSPVEAVAHGLNAREWGILLSETETLLSKTYILFRRKHAPGSHGALPVYDVYKRDVWDSFFSSTVYKSVDASEGMPVYVEGNLGFELNPRGIGNHSQVYQFLALGSLLLLGLNLFRMMVQEIRRRVREQRDRLFILQTLTHELRTPVSSMKLSLEPMREDFEELPKNSQRAFLRMTEGLSRLKRVIEASTQYLKADGESGEIAFAKERVELRFWLECFMEDYQLSEERTVMCSLPEEVHLEIDPYWLEMCVQNLLDNAFTHGKQPVRLSLSREKNWIRITVQDEGDLNTEDFSQFLNPFSRESEAEGLGLGLTLVHRVTHQMGGELRLEGNPTRISLEFEEKL